MAELRLSNITSAAEVMVQSSQPWYAQWFDTPYYHALYADRDEREAAAFLERLLQELRLPAGARMLDVACGQGRHARVLATKGYEVTGIDLSERNIARARQQGHERLAFFRHDMRQMLHVRYYDAVLNLFTSFGYFPSDAENSRALRNMALALRPKGKLVIDFLNAPVVIAGLVPEETLFRGGYEFFIRRKVLEGRRPVLLKEIVVRDGQISHRFYERVVAYGRDDFLQWFSTCRLNLVGQFGNYRLEPFAAMHSPRLILVAEREAA